MALFPRIPQGLNDNRDYHGLNPVEQPAGLGRRSITDISPGKAEHDQHSGQDETGSGNDQSKPASAYIADVDCHFGGIRARD